MEPNNQIDNLFEIQIDAEAQQHIRTATYWARIIAVLAFVGIGVSLISTFSKAGGYGFGFTLIIQLIYAAFIVILNMYLLRFAKNTSQGADSTDQVSFNMGINSLRIYFKIIGIVLIICLALFTLSLFFGLIGGLMR